MRTEPLSDTDDPKYYSVKDYWLSEENAAAYRRSRSPERFKRLDLEVAILGSWLDKLEKNSLVLDIPCGTGRCLPAIVRRGLKYIGADISPAMIAEAERAAQREPNAKLIQRFVVADAEHLEFEDNSVDCVVMWRFLHHIRSTQIRQRVLDEAARVARSKVLISFHHPISFTNLRKWAQRLYAHDTSGSAAITQWRLRRESEGCGLRLVETRGFRKYISINWFACLAKRGG